jgi:selenide,water dikinase
MSLTAESATSAGQTYRLTQYVHGGGCACKIPPGDLEEMLGGLTPWTSPDLVVGLATGDDAAVVRIEGGQAVVSTTDFFTAVVDDAYDFGRIAAANALSDIYAMGAKPLVALNLVGWPRDVLPLELLREVLRGGMDVGREAEVHVAGGQSIDDPEPKYGMAVTGLADPDRLLRNDAAAVGLPVSLTKPLGIGVLNNRHKATGEVFPQAVETMVRLNRAASEAALAAGVRAATDVTGFGLLGHAYKMARASGVTIRIDAASVPYLDGAREALRDGFVSGGTRRNLSWVQAHLDASVDEDELLLLADAQTSGGLLVVGEVPGAPVVGEVVAGGTHPLVVR